VARPVLVVEIPKTAAARAALVVLVERRKVKKMAEKVVVRGKVEVEAAAKVEKVVVERAEVGKVEVLVGVVMLIVPGTLIA
jgi:hypothetical protein